MKTKKLLVIIPDRLTDLLKKGEVTERYYNPCNFFDEVHLMLINDDNPDKKLIKPMAGTAKLFLHNYPEPKSFFKKTLGWRPFLMRSWANKALDKIKGISPDMIRCHGVYLNSYIAAVAKNKLNIPYLISLHINPEADIRRHKKKEMSSKNLFIYKCQRAFEKYALSNCNRVICVYKWIVPYTKSFGAKNIEVIYNVINEDSILPKKSYEKKGEYFKCVIPGRQFIKKDPSIVLELLPKFPNLKLDLIGHGPYNAKLKELTKTLKIDNQVNFIESIRNDDLCKNLHKYDFVISVNDYGGISKVELESAFTGMPIITNKIEKEGLPEVLEKNVLTYNDKNSLEESINKIISSATLRQELGSNVRSATKNLRGSVMEKKYATLYKKVMEETKNG